MPRALPLLGGLALCVLLASTLWSIKSVSSPSVAGPFTRLASDKVLWGNAHKLQIALTLDATSLPQCPVSNSSNIVLLLDRSASMAGDRFRDALSAAGTFIQTVDLDRNRVAVIFFSDTARVAQPLSNDRSALLASLSSQAPGGSTQLNEALLLTNRTLFQEQTTAGIRSIVILLSDGRSNTADDVVATAQLLKDADTRIVTIGFHSDNTSMDLLRQLASRPSDALPSGSESAQPTSSELQAIYLSLADEVNQAMAFDLTISEVINSEEFIITREDVQPPAFVTHEEIAWQMAAVVSGENPVFRYSVTPNSLGLATLSAGQGTAAWVDCTGALIEMRLPPGPQVLLLPTQTWMIAALLFLIVPLGMAFWRRRTPPPASPPSVAPSPVPPPVDPGAPSWLRQLDSQTQLGTNEPVEESVLQPTVLIGCGEAGREVLSQIAQDLRSRFGGKIPASIRLLQIDISLPGAVEPPVPHGLDVDQRVLLIPNLAEVEANLRNQPTNWQHWQWFEGSAPDYERARSRMAIFYDLKDGSNSSFLWRRLQQAFSELRSPKVRVIGTTFDDISSGILIDVARLTQAVNNLPIDVEFWLATATDQPWSSRLHDPRELLRPEVQCARTLATLRELERFQRNTPMPFNYVPPNSLQAELRAQSGGVVQSLFLFEPQTPLSPPEHDVFPCMADALLALLHPTVNTAVRQQLDAHRATAGALINREGVGMAHALGAFSFRLPTAALREAMSWRGIRDLLFDVESGLLPLEETLPNGNYRDSEGRETLTRDEIRSDAERLVARYLTSSQSLAPSAFLNALRLESDRFFNGTDTRFGHTGGLGQARLWLSQIRALLIGQGEHQTANQVQKIVVEIQEWEAWLAGPVRRVNEQRWQEVREPLDLLRLETSRDWMIDESLEWPAYNRIVRTTPGDGSSNNLLHTGARRFGWEIQKAADGGWDIHLVVPTPDFIWEAGIPIKPYRIDRKQSPEQLLDALYRVVHPLMRQHQQAKYLLDRAESYDSREWLIKARPRLAYNETEASQRMRQLSRAAILVGPEHEHARLERVNSRLQGSAREAATWSVHPTSDEGSITLLRLDDWIPLPTAKLYNDDTWNEHPVLPQSYVWRVEQIAAEIEQDGTRLSSRFMALLAADEYMVQLFALSYLYELVVPTPHGWEAPVVGVLTVSSPGKALEVLVETPPTSLSNEFTRDSSLRRWQEQLDKRQHELANQRISYLRRARDERINPLLKSQDNLERDLGRYLTFLSRA